MNSSCIAGCLDAQTPVKVNFVKLSQWAEADAKFLQKLSNMNDQKIIKETGRSPFNSHSPVCHESYASSPRQRYLRSYTFRRKETVAEKTKKWFKETESKRRSGSTGTSCSFLEGVFNFLFFCVAEVNVHEH